MINKVEMTNWRKYKQHEVQFRPGINFIVGANGAGKTSILEAIAVALTGEPSTLRERSKLLRDPNQLATVDLSFTVDGLHYRVKRSQSDKRAHSAHLWQVGSRQALATGHGKVTAAIEQIMNVSAEFWRRVVYMAEGDVFHFLSSPPGKALDSQLQRLVGLTQLNEFEVALKRAEREMKGRIKGLTVQLDQLRGLQIESDEELDQRIAQLDQSLASLISSVESMSKEQARLEQENKLLREWVAPLVDKALLLLQEEPHLAPLANQMAVIELEKQVRGQVEKLEASQQALLQNSQALAQDGLSRIETLLMAALPAPDSQQASPCPLCGKPIGLHERSSVRQHIQAFVGQLEQNKQQVTERLSDINQQIKQLRPLSNQLASLSELLQRTSFTDPARATLLDIQNQIEAFAEYYEETKTNENLRTYTDTLNANQQQRAYYLTISNRLAGLGFDSVTEARNALLQLETRSLSLRAAQEAVKQTITRHRNRDIEPIYEQIAQLWQNFTSADHGTWHIQLDAKGMPLLSNAEGRQFTLNQFSGGEKTAFLLMLHTIVAHHFSKSNFLLIDEPLEHLDPVNRRSLIRFLIEAYRKGAFKQAIVTTFEESLLRKYMSDEAVHLIYLS
jgi:DNA repair exonuclease SbcCD ATPase subunit